MWLGQRILQVIVDAGAGQSVSVAHIAEATDLTPRQCNQALAALVRNEFCIRTTADEPCFYITDAGRQILDEKNAQDNPDKPKTIRERVWHAMRMRRKFAVVDLLPLVQGTNPENEQALVASIRYFFRALVKVGVLQELKTRLRHGQKRYLLVNDLGPRTPLTSKNCVFDPNSNKEVQP